MGDVIDMVWVASMSVICNQILIFASVSLLGYRSFDECLDKEGRKRPDDVVLVLRRWCKLIPSSEFRCFVKDNKIIGNYNAILENASFNTVHQHV